MINFNLLKRTNMYIVAPGMTFPLRDSKYKALNIKTILFIQIQDERSKERKMIDTINKLEELGEYSENMFYFYNPLIIN